MKQQLLMLGPVILKNGILVWIYFYFFENIFPRYIFICVFTFFFVIDMFPTIVVHIQYLYRNFGALLVIDTKMKSISYKTEGYFVEHSFDDIFSIQHFASYGGRSGIYSFGEYRFFKILFKDNTEIVITCLMMNNIKKKLEELLNIKSENYMKIIAFIN